MDLKEPCIFFSFSLCYQNIRIINEVMLEVKMSQKKKIFKLETLWTDRGPISLNSSCPSVLTLLYSASDIQQQISYRFISLQETVCREGLCCHV